MGFKFLKETPDSADSDFIMEKDMEEKQIPEKGKEVFEACRGKIQQIAVSMV